MSTSTLDMDELPGTGDGVTVGQGHGTRALGPSDSSDSGSDLVGGPGLLEGEVLDLDRGTNEDAETGDARHAARNVGAEIGDLDLDSDSDSGGTGERMAAGRDPSTGTEHDRGFDRVVGAEEAGLGSGLDQAEEARLGVTDEDLEEATGDEAGETDSADRATRKAKKPSDRGLGGGADFSDDASEGGGFSRA